MRILSFNQNWLAQELRELGHEVVTCGHVPGLDARIPKRVIPIQDVLLSLKGFSPDVLLFLDDSMPAFMTSGLDTCEIPSVFYSVDSHQHDEVHPLIAPLFDHVLVAQRDYIPLFEKSGVPNTWFPLWAPRYAEPATQKKYQASFVGTLNSQLNPRRVKFFEQLARRIPIHVSSGAYVEIFPLSEMVVNQTVKGDLNFRVFEAMMCGAALLTERTQNGLLDLFKEGVHLITYTSDDVEEVTEKFQALSDNPHILREIAFAGREEVLQRHTGMHRALQLEGILRDVRKRGSSARQHYVSMVNNAIINRLLIQQQQAPCHYAASYGILAAEAGFRARLVPTEAETTHLIMTCSVFDQLTGAGAGAELLRQYHESHLRNPLIALAWINALLEKGDQAGAQAVARASFNQSPEQTFILAQQIVPQIARGDIQLPVGR